MSKKTGLLIGTLLAFATALAIVAFAQQGPSPPLYTRFDQALYADHKNTVWVNSFDQAHGHTYLAHGAFRADIPSDPQHHGYEERYSMLLTGSGVVATSATGQPLTAAGTVTNPGTYQADGSFQVDLLRNGGTVAVDQVVTAFAAPLPPGGSLGWSVTFTTLADGATYTVRVYRHTFGALVGERHIDMNGTCHDAITDYFRLPRTYVFSASDDLDQQYVASRYNANESVMDVEIAPLCRQPGPEPTGTAQPTPTATLQPPCTCYDRATNTYKPPGCRVPINPVPDCEGPAPTPTPGPTPCPTATPCPPAKPCRKSNKLTFTPACTRAIEQLSLGKPNGPNRTAGLKECPTSKLPQDGVVYAPGIMTSGVNEQCLDVSPQH